jgi:hypothetical protein
MGYREEVLADGPALYFGFEDSLTNEGSLSPSVSSSGVDYTAGVRGQAGLFDGSAFVEAQTGSLYGSEWTVEAYFKSSSTADYNTIVRASGSQHVLLRVRGSNIGGNANRLECYVAGNGGSVASFASTAVVNDGNWHHAVLTQRGGIISMFVDGSLDGQSVGVGSISNLTSPQQIGREASGSEFFNGVLDEVVIYSHALSDERIVAHFNYTEAAEPLDVQSGVANALALRGLEGPTIVLGAIQTASMHVLAGRAGVLSLRELGATLNLGQAPEPEAPQGQWSLEVLMESKTINAANQTASVEVRNTPKRVRTELKTLVRA